MLALRALIFYFFCILTITLHAIVCLIIGPFLPLKNRFRLFLLWNMFVIWWLKISCNLHVEVIGKDNVPPGSFVLLSNHQSAWETIFFYHYFTPVCAILKKELLNLPFFGWGIKLLHPIAIDRTRRREARKMVLQQGKQRLDDGISVMIFPEGTRISPGQRKKFSSGGAELAIASGAPILPIAHDAGRFWPAHRLIKFPGVIRVIIGKPIETQGREVRELTKEVEDWIHNTLEPGHDSQA